jgi:hypothetical protein
LTKLPLAFFEVYIDRTYNDNNEVQISDPIPDFRKNCGTFVDIENPDLLEKQVWKRELGNKF